MKREPLRIGAGGGPENRFHGSIDDVRIYNRALSPAEAGMLADLTPVTAIAALPEDKRSAAQADKIRDYFLEHALPAHIAEARTQLTDAQAKRDAFYRQPSHRHGDGGNADAARDAPADPRDVRPARREVVTPALPAVLASSPTAYPPNRLGLARWLVDPSNPLMARVTVNRFWQMYFGTGIVKTAEDFGSQGEPPSHPELLDWLATEFVRTGWDVKALQKTIVMSATYRQASRADAGAAGEGSRQPAARARAERPALGRIVRDQALAHCRAAGEQDRRAVGEAVPAGGPVERSRAAASAYVQDHGDNLYRRSLYTFWKRTIPPPSMANFDASAARATWSGRW